MAIVQYPEPYKIKSTSKLHSPISLAVFERNTMMRSDQNQTVSPVVPYINILKYNNN